MTLRIEEEVYSRFPGIRIAFFLYSGPIEYDSSEKALSQANYITQEVRRKYKDRETIQHHYLNDLYKNFYLQMRLKIKDVSTPLKQASRFLQSDYTSKNFIIDHCMAIEYLTGASFQLYDARKIGGTITYSVASNELTLSTHNKVIHTPSQGNSSQFSLDENTQDVLIRLMGIPGMKDHDWQSAVAQTLELGARPLTS